jgi:hypothetical protein
MDVGDVLVRTSSGAQYRELARRTGCHPLGLAQLVSASGLPAALECGLVDETGFVDGLRDLLCFPNLTLADVQECWAAELVAVDPLLCEVAARWAEQRCLVLASNTNPLHWPLVCRLLASAGIRAPAYVSFEMGVTKPHPRFFAMVVDDPVRYAGALYVDDRADNVAAAAAAGLTGWLHRDATKTAAYLMAALVDAG